VVCSRGIGGRGGKDPGANQVRLGDGTRISLELPEEQQPEPDDIRGAVSGVVVNEAIFPVPGARVSVRDRTLEATTDEEGRFVFEAMPPGLYTLVVRMDGYGDGLGTINVRSGQVVKSILQVHRLPAVDPYHTTLKFEEVYEGTDGWVGAIPDHLVAFDRHPATVILEAHWDGLVETGLQDLLRYTAQPESEPDSSEAGAGPNPLRAQFDADFFPADEYAIRFNVYPSETSLSVESRGEVFLTLFYVDPAPDGWSLVQGDP
jgi:hypothetical protein